MNFTILVGNVMDGIRFYGPFDTLGDAQNYAETFCEGEEWSVTIPTKPEYDHEGNWVAPSRHRDRVIDNWEEKTERQLECATCRRSEWHCSCCTDE